jgi:hypothetical protein
MHQVNLTHFDLIFMSQGLIASEYSRNNTRVEIEVLMP